MMTAESGLCGAKQVGHWLDGPAVKWVSVLSDVDVNNGFI